MKGHNCLHNKYWYSVYQMIRAELIELSYIFTNGLIAKVKFSIFLTLYKEGSVTGNPNSDVMYYPSIGK